MNTLFFEILQEEIPARMQEGAEEQLHKLVSTFLVEQRLDGQVAEILSTPRRLACYVVGLPAKQPDQVIEQKGPRIDAPQQAIEGFLRSHNASIEDCEQQETSKGTFLLYKKHVPGVEGKEYARALVQYVLQKFSWPKSMKWLNPELRWSRPIRQLIVAFNNQLLEGHIMGVPLASTTYGHRVLSDGALPITSFEQYKADLNKAFVLFREQRRAKILQELNLLHEKAKAAKQLSPKVLNEMIGLTEYPVMLLGKIPTEYMDLPQELLATTMEQHQRYAPFYDTEGNILPYFAFAANNVPNIQAPNVTTVILGNEKVLNARLSDGSFYWEDDKQLPLYAREGDSYYSRLSNFVFHNGLGTMKGKTDRFAQLAETINEALQVAEATHVTQAAHLLKGDLASGVVSEFPDLQGIIGSHLALYEGVSEEIASCIQEHYKPLGPEDAVPSTPLAAMLALADKTDTLVGFFAINEKPTGSRDPYSLRRAALGILRIVLHYKWDIEISGLFDVALAGYPEEMQVNAETLVDELCQFLYQRLESHLKEEGVPVWVIRSVTGKDIAEEGAASLVKDIREVHEMLSSAPLQDLIAVVKRCKNILPDGFTPDENWADYKGMPKDEALLEELALLYEKGEDVETRKELLTLMSLFAPKLNTYLDEVTINDENEKLRAFRFNILYDFFDAFNEVLRVEYMEF